MKPASAPPLLLFSVVAVSACAGPAAVKGEFDPILPFGPESPWTARPSLEDARRIIPSTVLATRELQSVFLRCEIAVSGRLADCEVDHESRSGIGLGEAALEAAKLSSLKPVLTNGAPSAGRFVCVSMNFDIGGAVDRPDYGGIYPFLIDLSDSKPGPVVRLPPSGNSVR